METWTGDNCQLKQFAGTCQLPLRSDRATMQLATRPPVIWHACGSGLALGYRLTGEAAGGHNISQTTHSLVSSFEGKRAQWKNMKRDSR